MVRKNENGTFREIRSLGIGDLFGEVSLISGLPRFYTFICWYNLIIYIDRTCSVIANENPTVVLELTKKAFNRLTNNFQNLKVKLAMLVEQRLTENKQISNEIYNSS